jgi:hypothetical protein
MKRIFLLLISVSLSCTDSGSIDPVSNTNPSVVTTPVDTSPVVSSPVTSNTDQKLIFEGTFVNGTNNTSGKAKVFENSKGVKTLSFENFKTDAGPDLRIYFAEDKAITNFVEISKTVKNGDSSYELPANVNMAKQKFILIWCKQFSKLFGSSELKSK